MSVALVSDLAQSAQLAHLVPSAHLALGFLRPSLLLLLAPALCLLWATRGRSHGVTALRVAIVLLLCGALALPHGRLDAPGRDLMVLVDRSRSMPSESAERALELIRLAQAEAGSGDRVGVLGFGGEPGLERLPIEDGPPFQTFERDLDPDATDLARALEDALAVLPEGRRGSLVVLSDGESTGSDPLDVARRALGRGVPVHVLPARRDPRPDLAVERIELPTDVAVGEPFQFSVWVHADAAVESSFELRRGDVVLSSGLRSFEPGRNRILFRDVLLEPGIAAYDVALRHAGDATPENDTALGAVRARGGRRLLVLNHDGGASPLVRALQGAALPVDVAAPEDLRLDALSLARWRGVVLENVSAARIGRDAMEALEEFVVERGGGLWMTGGRAAFGVGGYHLTPVERLLPVSLEQRQEHRKQGVALTFVLDTSGSMGAIADASTGTTKMDLANAGTLAALDLLSSLDSVAVIAVDSSPTTVVPLRPVSDLPGIRSRVRGIQAGGGGIFVYSGLVAAAEALDGAPQRNRHIVLFADAADAEEPEGVSDLVLRLGEMGTTVSVIALGTEADADAEFLMDIAWDGGGEAYFTESASELPELFAQDTLTIARSTFVEERVAIATLPDVVSLGRLDLSGWPDVDGYNLCYVREGALTAAATTDEYRAPLLSFWYQGVGRVAAYTGQFGPEYGAGVLAWERFADLAVTVARWIAGQEEPEELFADVRREGRELVLSVEVDPEAPTPPDTSSIVARVAGDGGLWQDTVLERVGAHRYEARAPLRQEGVTLGTIRVGDASDPAGVRVLELPPLTLPYSPEFERSPDPERGPRLLRRLAEETGGRYEPAVTQLFEGERGARVGRVFSRELVLAALCLALLEIAARRLALFDARFLRTLGPRLLALLRRPAQLLARLRPASPRSAPARAASPPPLGATGDAEDLPSSQSQSTGTAPGAPDAPAPSAGDRAPQDLADALARARSRSRRQTRR